MLALAIFIVTLVLVIRQPKNLGIGWKEERLLCVRWLQIRIPTKKIPAKERGFFVCGWAVSSRAGTAIAFAVARVVRRALAFTGRFVSWPGVAGLVAGVGSGFCLSGFR